jgi:hypothetical protein
LVLEVLEVWDSAPVMALQELRPKSLWQMIQQATRLLSLLEGVREELELHLVLAELEAQAVQVARPFLPPPGPLPRLLRLLPPSPPLL